ncbi:MAG: hypothetical protein K8T26_08105 [Lentisphaerae bacterium]|nr:hypothetical protein [Lentisphaerota bacterium]
MPLDSEASRHPIGGSPAPSPLEDGLDRLMADLAQLARSSEPDLHADQAAFQMHIDEILAKTEPGYEPGAGPSGRGQPGGVLGRTPGEGLAPQVQQADREQRMRYVARKAAVSAARAPCGGAVGPEATPVDAFMGATSAPFGVATTGDGQRLYAASDVRELATDGVARVPRRRAIVAGFMLAIGLVVRMVGGVLNFATVRALGVGIIVTGVLGVPLLCLYRWGADRRASVRAGRS